MSWIRLDNGTRVNTDHIETVEFREPVDAIGLTHHRVLFYPLGVIDPIVACEGSEQKCRRFLVDLDDVLNSVFIQAYELVKCQCECGCEHMIREGFTLCDYCDNDWHHEEWREHLLEKEAELLAHFPGLAPFIKKDAA